MSSKNWPFSLKYLPLIIQLECCEETHLPAYLGSTLRGALGWILQSNKEAYYYLFENRRRNKGTFDIVNPYIIEPPKSKSIYQKGDLMTFTFILLGEAMGYKEAIVTALVEADTLMLGSRRGKFQMQAILHGESLKTIWDRENPMVQLKGVHSIPVLNLTEHADWCSLQLQTPLRIRRQGNMLDTLDFPTLVRNITKRIELLTERYGGAIDKQNAEKVNVLSSKIQQTTANFFIHQMDRYSNRKSQKMDFSGLLGISVFEGELAVFTPWLQAAEILHIGRNTTFGYGKINIILGEKDASTLEK